jgi:hypothetical protein
MVKEKRGEIMGRASNPLPKKDPLENYPAEKPYLLKEWKPRARASGCCQSIRII